jgi:hypothetical protein
MPLTPADLVVSALTCSYEPKWNTGCSCSVLGITPRLADRRTDRATDLNRLDAPHQLCDRRGRLSLSLPLSMSWNNSRMPTVSAVLWLSHASASSSVAAFASKSQSLRPLWSRCARAVVPAPQMGHGSRTISSKRDLEESHRELLGFVFRSGHGSRKSLLKFETDLALRDLLFQALRSCMSSIKQSPKLKSSGGGEELDGMTTMECCSRSAVRCTFRNETCIRERGSRANEACQADAISA